MLRVQMNDEDSVRRVHRALGMGTARRIQPPSRTLNPAWVWEVYGFEKVQAAVALLWFGLGGRRRQKAREVLVMGRPRSGSYQGHRGFHRPIPAEVRTVAAWV
jgi:hypothetical protein